MSDARGDQREAAQRQSALRALAQQQTQLSGGATPPPHATAAVPLAAGPASQGRRNPAWRLAISTLSVLAVVAVIGIVVANIVIGQRPAAPAAKTALRLNPIGDGLSCVQQIAWSPDSKQVAVLGNTVNCGASSSVPQTGTVKIYDARSGKVVRTLQPDDLVFKAPAVSNAIAATEGANSPTGVTLSYLTLTWAPNGQTLVLPFAIDIMPPEGQSGADKQMPGLLRLGVAQPSQSAVWLDTAPYLQMGSIERWDLTTGASKQLPAPPPATAYRWNSDGTLSPASVTASQPVGTPDGGETFTIWQPGQLGYPSFQPGPNAQPTVSPQDVSWGANITPISPDGRYFYTYFPAGGSLVPPSTKIVMPHDTRIAPRDKALLALAQSMTHATISGALPPQTFVAWRADGHLLAELPANSAAPVSASAFTVSLYDTATGKLVMRLTPDLSGLQTGPAGVEALMWSPDGKRLLLMDNIYGSITIWGPGALPA